jgi:hypothetical protein
MLESKGITETITVSPSNKAVYFKQVTYKIEILYTSSPVPLEFQDDFVEWLKNKAVESGVGKKVFDNYHNETGGTWIEVTYLVTCV